MKRQQPNKPARTLDQLSDEELLQGIQHYEHKILTRKIFGYAMTERDKEFVKEWQGKIDTAYAELERRKPKQGSLI